MIIGSPEHEQWWQEVQLHFRWIDHYMNEFGEHPSLKINQYIYFQNQPIKKSHTKGYPKLGG